MPSATTAPATHTSLPPSFNAYRVLSLPALSTPATLSTATIKTAYRRALLTHHPDKLVVDASTPSRSDDERNRQGNNNYTIDDVTLAYKTLLDPSARAAHDRSLRLRNSRPGFATADTDGEAEAEAEAEEEWRLGLEVVDLDDLEYGDDNEAGCGGLWWRSCRCGEKKGFVVDEQALEEAAEAVAAAGGGGEVLVGCVGCSLWIRVGFAVAED